MATCTTSSNCRRTEELFRSSRRAACVEDEAGVGLRSGAADRVEDESELIDFWGSRDSLTCLANWG